MILICGIPSEPPLAMVREHLAAMGAPVFCFNQRATLQAELEFEIGRNHVAGVLRVGNDSLQLEDVAGVYTRMMDEQLVPELRDEAPGSTARTRAQEITIGLANWMEIAPARVINRASSMASNGSKPLQAQTIREHGFQVPETLITNDLDEVATFRARHGKVVFKSISGVRSIVCELGEDEMARLDRIRACPVQFQEKVEGCDVRVHVVGTELFATRVESGAADYRYAARDGPAPALTPCELDDETAQRCLQLSSVLGLLFSGIDLRIGADGRVWCFEVNTSPGFSYYESNTGQPIARAVARLLAGDA